MAGRVVVGYMLSRFFLGTLLVCFVAKARGLSYLLPSYCILALSRIMTFLPNVLTRSPHKPNRLDCLLDQKKEESLFG